MPKAVSLDVNDDFQAFQTRLHEIIFKKLAISDYDEPSVKLYASWKSKTSVQGNKKPIQLSEYVDCNDEDDYEGIVQEIHGTRNASKTGLDKMMLCILADVTVSETGRQEEDTSVLDMSTPKRQTV